MRLPVFCWLLIILTIGWSGCITDTSSSDPNNLYPTDARGNIIYQGDLPNVVRTHLAREPKALHPILTLSAAKGMVLDYCFQSLLTVDEFGNRLPVLVRDLPIESPDKKTYTFELDPEAHWPDGAPITAQDVIFSFKLLTQSSAIKSYLENIQTISSPGEGTVVINARAYNFLNPYLGSLGYILDKRKFDPDGVLDDVSFAEMLSGEAGDDAMKKWTDWFKGPETGRNVDLLGSGSGPYQLTSWEEGRKIELTRMEDYWGLGREEFFHQAKPDAITFSFVQGNELLLQLEQQTLDVSMYVGSQTWLDLRENDKVVANYVLDTVVSHGITALILNNQPDGKVRKPFFSDSRTRKAVALAISEQRLIDEQLGGLGKATGTPVPAGNLFHNPELKPVGYDPNEAMHLLTAAGWVDSNGNGIRDSLIDGELVEFEMEMYRPTANNKEVRAAVGRMQDQLRAVGIAVEFTDGDVSTFYLQTLKKEFDAGIMALSAGATPYEFKPLWHSEAIGGFNVSLYSNPDLDALIDIQRQDTSLSRQRDYALTIQEILYQDMPVIYLFYNFRKSVIHKRFNPQPIIPISPFVRLNTLEMMTE